MFKWYNNIYLFCCDKISNKLSDECLSCCSCHCFCSVFNPNSNDRALDIRTNNGHYRNGNVGDEMTDIKDINCGGDHDRMDQNVEQH